MNLDPLTARGAYTPPLVPMLGLEATVASTAITLADDVDVLTNDANLRIGPCRWQPRDGVYPTAGDACAVIQTNDGHNVLLWWKPAAAISPGVLGDITMGKLTAYSPATPASATFTQTHWLRSDKNTPTVFIGSADPTGAYAPTDYSGALRFNGAGVAWGDLAYYPNAVDGHFKLFRDGTVVGGTPAGLKVGSLYTSFVSPAVPSSPWLGIAGAALASGAAANGRVEMWDRLSLDTAHAFGSFTDPGSGGIFASGQILANGLANIAGDVYGGAFVRSRDATANATILGWNGSGVAAAIAFGAAYDAYIGRIAAGVVGTTGSLRGASVGAGLTPTSPLHVAGSAQVTDVGTSADTASYGVFGVTRAATAINLCYIAMTKSATLVKGIGINAANNLIIGQVAAGTGNAGVITPHLTIGSSLLGFYGGAGTAQAARPVTLADVITVLVNLGLTA